MLVTRSRDVEFTGDGFSDCDVRAGGMSSIEPRKAPGCDLISKSD